MLHYKAEEAGSEVVLVNPAYTSQECSSCGLIRKKTLAERWHTCSCGADMHRDLNAAINILKRATLGTKGSNACGDVGLPTPMKQEKPSAGMEACASENGQFTYSYSNFEDQKHAS